MGTDTLLGKATAAAVIVVGVIVAIFACAFGVKGIRWAYYWSTGKKQPKEETKAEGKLRKALKKVQARSSGSRKPARAGA